jgi:acetyl-CoA C-acetyltransferase
MSQIFICDNFRTPFGSVGGFLSKINPTVVGSFLLHHLMERNPGLSPDMLTQLMISNVISSNLGPDFATQVVNEAKLSNHISRAMVNAGHITGLKLVDLVSSTMNSKANVAVLLGLENISSVPNYIPNELVKRNNVDSQNMEPLNGVLRDGYFVRDINNFAGFLAEQICNDNKLKREVLDEFVLQTIEKARGAYASGGFTNEICTIKFNIPEGNSFTFTEDQEYRRYEKTPDIASLESVFVDGGKLTLASSARSADGGSLAVIANEAGVKESNLKPQARLAGYSEVYGDSSSYIESGVLATKQALKSAGVTAGNVDIWEIHEDFASTPLVYAKKMKMEIEKINRHGGTLSTGNPIGSTGLRLVNAVTNQMGINKSKYGVAVMCGPSGGSAAAVFEQV